MYHSLGKFQNKGNKGIKNASATINQTLYGENGAWELFRKQTKKGTSVTDCANAVVAHRFNISTIFF